MDFNKLYRIAAKFCLSVYNKNIDIGMGTQCRYHIVTIGDETWQVIAVAGTNDLLLDGIKNLNLFSWMGIKLSAYRAAWRIKKHVKIAYDLPLMITGHSLGGAAAIAYKKRFGADYCVAFAPANCLRRWRSIKMDNTTVFIDPDDPVTELLGKISFGLPKCETIKAKDDHEGYSLGDHPMSKWVAFVEEMA